MKKILFIAGIGCVIIAAGCSKNEVTVKPGQKVEYYRIKQVDADGKISYSPVKMIIVN